MSESADMLPALDSLALLGDLCTHLQSLIIQQVPLGSACAELEKPSGPAGQQSFDTGRRLMDFLDDERTLSFVHV